MGTKKDTRRLNTAAELRRHAEERLCRKTVERHPPWTEEGTLHLVHELEIHQIELETQNSELRQARDEMETALESYTDLYDFAPIGYFTLDGSGAVRAVNLAGACLVGGVRSRLVGQQFGVFVAPTDRSTFTDFLGTTLTCHIKGSCEVALLKDGNQPLIVQIEAMATASGQEFRLALIDITERRCAEAELAKQRRELEDINSSLQIRVDKAVDDPPERPTADPAGSSGCYGRNDQQYRSPVATALECAWPLPSGIALHL